MKKYYINTELKGYAKDPVKGTMTVGELIAMLSQVDEDALIYLRNDAGHVYDITYSTFDVDLEEA